ncbi:DUF305 domain-containing protein [Spirilliplanes yamanashiensis]|uniref:DUF305 domain-containing protein n=1 Tax=Spirilliplanes yamanashiensis TaxID=42233 RepID=A0A8J4DHB6_9ACTN|nr:DUF305 domain-containing protein [Spirilliplanes yamanashiensis]MDP9819953.1 uncharacterized protein (DUF305 family) [Spirilliplanes yamanashiensis]GIJ01228.1 hypothetical protein Sya03_05800 [Spirilliplanes yamanashiensis]
MATTTETAAAVESPSTAPAGGAYRWVLALLVGLALGVGVGIVAPRLLTTGPAENSPEAGFARDMSTHHAQAVEMGMIAYTSASNGEVRFMGRDIALTQQGQVGMMQSWLREWDLSPTGDEPPMAWMPNAAGSVQNGLMPGMATPQEIEKLKAATGPAADRLFLELMIRHHLGGIHMAQAILDVTDEDQVREMAQIAVDGQQRELNDMNALLKTLP